MNLLLGIVSNSKYIQAYLILVLSLDFYRVAFDLMTKYLDKGYRLYMGNFYASLQLLKSLKEINTLTCSTVQVNRVEFPNDLKVGNLDHGKSTCICNDVIVAVHWKDKRQIYSWCHSVMVMMKAFWKDRMVTSSNYQCINYNNNMGGVTKHDQCLSYYEINRKSMKCWRASFHLFKMCIVNAMKLFLSKNPEFQVRQMHKNVFKKCLSTKWSTVPGLIGWYCYCEGRSTKPIITTVKSKNIWWCKTSE